MKYITHIFLYVLLLVSIAAKASNDAVNLQDKLNAIHTMQAKFKQVISAKNTDSVHSSGKMALAKPQHFRWQTLKPMPQLFLADGKHVWIYDEELEQVSVRAQGQNLTGAAAIFLSDNNNNVAKDFTVKHRVKSNLDYFDLTAKAAKANFQRVKLVFKDQDIVQIELFDELGQHTKVAFSDININPKLGSKMFKFIVPRGTDVVHQ